MLFSQVRTCECRHISKMLHALPALGAALDKCANGACAGGAAPLPELSHKVPVPSTLEPVQWTIASPFMRCCHHTLYHSRLPRQLQSATVYSYTIGIHQLGWRFQRESPHAHHDDPAPKQRQVWHASSPTRRLEEAPMDLCEQLSKPNGNTERTIKGCLRRLVVCQWWPFLAHASSHGSH